MAEITNYQTLIHDIHIATLSICDKFQILITQTTNGDSYFWDISTGELLQTFISEATFISETDGTPCIALDPKNNFIAIGQGQTIQIVRLPELTIWQRINTPKPVNKLFISPNSELLVIVYALYYLMPNTDYGSLVVFWHLSAQRWDSKRIDLPRPTTSGSIEKADILISPQWNTLLLALEYERNEISRFLINSYQLSKKQKPVIEVAWGYNQLFGGYAFNPQGKLLLVSNSVRLGGNPSMYTLFTTDKRPTWLTLTSKNLIFRQKDTLGIHITSLRSIDKSNEFVTLAEGIPINCAIVYAKGRMLATGSTTGEIQLWQLRDKKPYGVLIDVILTAHISSVTHFATTHDGHILASSSSSTVKLWRLANGSAMDSRSDTVLRSAKATFIHALQTAVCKASANLEGNKWTPSECKTAVLL